MASPTDMSLFPVLAAEKLPLPDIERAFHLSQTNRTDWAQFRTPFEIPDSETSRGEGLGQVGLRYRLSVLLCSIHCAAPDDPGFPGLPQIPISGKRRFSFQPVIYDGDEWCLRGSPDYSIWYNAETREDGPGVSALIREMREGRASRGVPQTLALMGVSVPATLVSTLTISLCMVYAHRQCEDKARKTVFGLSTDGAQFCFLHINGDGEVSGSSQRQRSYILTQMSGLNSICIIPVIASRLSRPWHTSTNTLRFCRPPTAPMGRKPNLMTGRRLPCS